MTGQAVVEAAGADALELNLYYLATDPELTAARLEENYISLIGNIRECIKIPLAVKLSPFFTSIPNICNRLVKAGANGLVLFNRFYQPDFDLEAILKQFSRDSASLVAGRACDEYYLVSQVKHKPLLQLKGLT